MSVWFFWVYPPVPAAHMIGYFLSFHKWFILSFWFVLYSITSENHASIAFHATRQTIKQKPFNQIMDFLAKESHATSPLTSKETQRDCGDLTVTQNETLLTAVLVTQKTPFGSIRSTSSVMELFGPKHSKKSNRMCATLVLPNCNASSTPSSFNCVGNSSVR